MTTPAATNSTHRDYFISIADRPIARGRDLNTWYARSQNSLVAWSEVSANERIEQQADHEIIVVLPDTGAFLGARGMQVEAPARSICILPAGSTSVAATAPGRVIRFFSPVPQALQSMAINWRDYDAPHPGVRPIAAPSIPVGNPGIRVYRIDGLKRDRRPPTFQSQTMNVMWIERDGPQDRAKLDPHAHDDFEESALVVTGEYIQHLRTPWDANATTWRADEHRTCIPGMLTIVPPTVIHASETVGTGPHLMLNIFAPARADHIESGMVLNASDYITAS